MRHRSCHLLFNEHQARSIWIVSASARRANHFALSKVCQACLTKIFLFRISEIHVCMCASRFRWRGASRSSRTWEAGCDGREGAQRGLPRRRKHSLRTAKSCCPGTPTLVSSLADDDREATEANKPGTPGRPRIRRKPSRRECRRVFGCTCRLPVCVLSAFAAHEARGCNGTRHFLRPCVPEICQNMPTGGSHQPPVAGTEPVAPKGDRACNGARDSSGVFLNPNSCKGFEPVPGKEGSG